MKKLIIIIFILILLIIGTRILKMKAKSTNVWNYKKIDSASNLIYYGEEIDDRYYYWQLKDIILKFISTMEDEEFDSEALNENKVEYTAYYEVLTKEYRKYIGRAKYEILANDFITRFLLEDHLGNKYINDFVIDKIYRYNSNKYLCFIKTVDGEDEGYIGIELNEKENTFGIFYIE